MSTIVVRRPRRLAALAAGALGLVACTSEPSASRPQAQASQQNQQQQVAAPFERRALEVAAQYRAWGRIDDEARWAPYLCRMPLPAVASLSESSDAATHGGKLYSVFVRHRDAYPEGAQPADQVVVKESWKAEPVRTPYAPEAASFEGVEGDHFYPFARKGDVVYRAAERAGLYLMFKVEPAGPATDDGWVYATVTAAGQVTAAGRVASCMACHEQAPHDRLFGVPKSPR